MNLFYYKAYGLPVISEIALPALLPVSQEATKQHPIYIKIGVVPEKLNTEGVYADDRTLCNANEAIFTAAGEIKFYISQGNSIVVQPIDPDYTPHLIYLYSNGLAAALYQRNLIPFHVSGVFVGEGRVALFAAPSKTGKSTLAVKLQELGYKPFTDDTAVLFIKDNQCYAQASYPMIRLWQHTLPEQNLLNTADKQKLYEVDEVNKYGFSFHEHFAEEPVEVAQILFLKEEGNALVQQSISPLEAFSELANNVYRCHWIPAMEKGRIQFTLISRILHLVPYAQALRPAGQKSFEEFPLFIKNILENRNT